MKKAETRKTFSEKEQIINVLKFGKKSKRWLSTREIVTIANVMGWTTPMDDPDRKAVSHPYSKILSMMTDPGNAKYYTDNIRCRVCTGKGRKIEFTID